MTNNSRIPQGKMAKLGGRKHRSGFSLLELLLATGMLSVALLLIIALGLSLVGRNRKALDVPVGVIAGESILTELIYSVTGDSPTNLQAWFAAVPSAPTAWRSGFYTVNHIDFAYSVDYQSVLGAGASGNNHLVLLQLRVTWQDGTTGIHDGQQHADLSRLLHES